MFGIGNAAANLTCTGNVIRNMRGNAQATGALNMGGIVITAVPTGVSTISQNTIHSLNDNAGTAEGAIYAIYGNFRTQRTWWSGTWFIHSRSPPQTSTVC